jgi:hypothetical protein
MWLGPPFIHRRMHALARAGGAAAKARRSRTSALAAANPAKPDTPNMKSRRFMFPLSAGK